MTVHVPWSSGDAEVVASRVPGNSISVINAPPAATSKVAVTPLPGGGGEVSVPLTSFDDGDAEVLAVTETGS